MRRSGSRKMDGHHNHNLRSDHHPYVASPTDEGESPEGGPESGYLPRDGGTGSPPSSDDEGADRAEAGRRRWALALFSATTVLLFADQNLMSPNLTAIAEDFGLSNDERDRKLGGDISLAFFLVGAPASFLVGVLADSGNRARIFGWTVFAGELACLLTYFARSYRQLYLCRAVTGFGVGGALPVIYSVLGDLYGAGDRHVASALVSFGLGAGISLGQAVAGYLGPIYGWRLPFLVISVPALVCAALVCTTVEDPERGAMETARGEAEREGLVAEEGGVALVPITSRSNLVDADASHDYVEARAGADHAKSGGGGGSSTGSWRDHVESGIGLLSTRSVALSLFQGAPGCVPWGVINVFLNDYLSEDRGFSVQSATTVLMCFSLGYALGLLVGGAGGKRLYETDPRLPCLLAGGTAIAGCFPLWYLLNGVDSSTPFGVAATTALAAGLLAAPTGPIVKATLTNVTLPRARGQAFALFNLFDDLGKGLGPYLVSLLIVGCGGRRAAFNTGVLGWVLCGVANLAMFFTVARDERAVQAALSAGRTGVPPCY
ncbi:unnamed protein product [Pseudo-nitzschia multistriata]|uniref:Major facilitator superfamily (MFS) profile domain-containing protein n=1 Tax=Pseudo-nitzschia multistriata TaxID=183589 RepID=A0A448ZEQ4_9STRA|nr:unnamed protein product [Pseudo-nitzschia multistriata]